MGEPARRIERSPAASPDTGGGGDRPRSGAAAGVPFTKEEVRALIRACDGTRNAKRNRAIILTAYDTACRVSELVRMKWPGVDWSGGWLKFWRPKVRKDHLVPLRPETVEALRSLRTAIRCTGAIFLSERGRPFTGRGIAALIKGLALDAGIPLHKAHPHNLRRSRATHLLKDGASFEAIRDLLGHQSVATTQRYVVSDPEYLRSQIGRSSLWED